MNTTVRRTLLCSLLAALPLAGCECTDQTYSLPERVESFKVEIKSIQLFNPGESKTVVASSESDPMEMPRLGALLEVRVTALDKDGNHYAAFHNPVSFRVTPGTVVAVSAKADPLLAALATGNTLGLQAENARMLQLKDGFAHGYVLVQKVFGATKLWAQDSPPPPVFALPVEAGDDAPASADAGVAVPDSGFQEPESRTHAAGVSDPFWFQAPTIADTQMLASKELSFGRLVWNNKGSPFVGNFLTIDAPPPTGDMIVTAITAEGFYAMDLLAKPVTDPFYTDDASGNRTFAGTFGYMYIYNYNYPDGLLTGDRVLSLTGTVQEFSGDTQMVFPSWVRKEGEPRPQDRAPAVVLDFSDWAAACTTQGFKCDTGGTGYFNSFRCEQDCGTKHPCPAGEVCGSDGATCGCQATPVDTCAAALGGGNHCDTATGKCVGGCPGTPCAEGEWCVQHRCVKPTDPCAGMTCLPGERCNALTGACECGPTLGYRVSKTPVWNGPPAPGVQSMDELFAYSNNNIEIESLESGIVKVVNAKPTTTFVNCDANGNGQVPPFRWAVPTAADGSSDFTQASWFCDDNGADTADCQCNRDCVIGQNAHDGKVCSEINTFRTYGQWLVQVEDAWKIRINVSTRDALPDFDPHEFEKPQYAGCRVDITGVLRQVQAARPRWLILARDEQDICCRAAEGGQCPTPENGGACPKCP